MTRLAVAAGALLLVVAPLPARETAPDEALQAMAAAERAFARAAAEKGIRDAFVEFFADDSIGFYPTPMNARDFYRKQPPTPLTRQLEWEPRLGDVAQSGDLGWLTGPFVSYDTASDRPRRHGCYFSIWAKREGAWKVLMDVGVPTPEAVTFEREGFSAVAEPGGRYASRPADTSTSNPEPIVGSQFSAGVAKDGAEVAYNRVLTAVSRMHVPGRLPLVGRDAILAWVRESRPTLRIDVDGGHVARSRDLAFAHGSYEETRGTGADAKVEKGFYVRVWKRIASGDWKLAAEVRSLNPG
jgi:ketosteroid isomerase-like protein